jgi:exodeoxyribonuclease V alpha subunit
MMQRNLLYTGVTRGKRLVVLVGQKKAVAIAVRNVSGRWRWSKLGEWLSLKASVSADRRRLNFREAQKIWIAQCEAAVAARYACATVTDLTRFSDRS